MDDDPIIYEVQEPYESINSVDPRFKPAPEPKTQLFLPIHKPQLHAAAVSPGNNRTKADEGAFVKDLQKDVGKLLAAVHKRKKLGLLKEKPKEALN